MTIINIFDIIILNKITSKGIILKEYIYLETKETIITLNLSEEELNQFLNLEGTPISLRNEYDYLDGWFEDSQDNLVYLNNKLFLINPTTSSLINLSERVINFTKK